MQIFLVGFLFSNFASATNYIYFLFLFWSNIWQPIFLFTMARFLLLNPAYSIAKDKEFPKSLSIFATDLWNKRIEEAKYKRCNIK